jgi:hypothetical protein
MAGALARGSSETAFHYESGLASTRQVLYTAMSYLCTVQVMSVVLSNRSSDCGEIQLIYMLPLEVM